MLQPEERGLGWHGLPSEWTSTHKALSAQPHCRGLYYLGQDAGDLHGGEGASAVGEDIPFKLQQGHFLTSMGRRLFFLLGHTSSKGDITAGGAFPIFGMI